MLLRGDLKDYSCVLFKQITCFIKKVLWLKLHIDDLFSCIVGCKMITPNQFGAKPLPVIFKYLVPLSFYLFYYYYYYNK